MTSIRRWTGLRRLHLTLPGRGSRVLAIQCTACRCWVKPRHFRTPAMICRDCDAAGVIQTWRPHHTTRAAR
jgi:hypothetical protein